jgi:hypothetical protein
LLCLLIFACFQALQTSFWHPSPTKSGAIWLNRPPFQPLSCPTAPSPTGLHPKGHKLSSTLTGRDLLQSDKGKQAQQAATARQAGKATQKGGKKGDTSTPPTDSNSDDSSSNPMGPITPTVATCGSCPMNSHCDTNGPTPTCVCNNGEWVAAACWLAAAV